MVSPDLLVFRTTKNQNNHKEKTIHFIGCYFSIV